MSETPLANDDQARSPTGEILDVRPVVVEPPKADGTTTPTTTTETKTEPTPSTETKVEPKVEAPKPGETLLTDKKETKEETKPAAPEAYADFKAPEGHTLDKATIDKATPIFKELGLSQDAAQKLVDLYAAQQIEAAKAPGATYEALRTDWRSKVNADPEIKAYATEGKTGLDAIKVDIGRALGTLDPTLATEFKAAMDLTGAGDHPAFVKAFWKLSQGITEGKHVAGRGPSPQGQRDPSKAEKPTAAQAMYPTNPSAAAR